MKFVSKEASTSLLPFWTVLSIQAVFSCHHSVHEILSKWFPTSLLTTTLGYGCSWAILFWAKHAPNSTKVIALKIVKWMIVWKKYIFLTLWRMQSRLQAFLLTANLESDRMMSRKHSLTAKTVSKWLPCFFEDEVLLDNGHFRGWNFASGKAEIGRTFSCYGRRQKSKLFGVTFSFNEYWQIKCWGECDPVMVYTSSTSSRGVKILLKAACF